jgi:hypothetical protein
VSTSKAEEAMIGRLVVVVLVLAVCTTAKVWAADAPPTGTFTTSSTASEAAGR